jgi:hypothetical protein
VLLGIPGYKGQSTLSDLWDRVRRERAGEVVPFDDDDGTPEMRLGHHLEPVILDVAEYDTGPLMRNPPGMLHLTLPLVAHPDAVVIATRASVEAKLVLMHNPHAREWGAPGTDEVPHLVRCQNMGQLMCNTENQHIVIVPRMNPASARVDIYYVPWDQTAIDLITEALLRFDRLVEQGIRPEPTTFDDVRKYWPFKPKATTTVDRELGLRFLALRDQVETFKLHNESFDAMKDGIRIAMKGHEIADCEGVGQFTCKPQVSQYKWDVEKMKADGIDVDKYRTQGRSDPLRFQGRIG